VYTHLKKRQWYEDIYDRITVESGRRDTKAFDKMYKKFFEIMPGEDPKSHRAVLYLNLFYMVFVGSDLINRYDRREERIRDMIAEDEAKDERVNNARLSSEPTCFHCHKTGLRITDKLLTHREGIYSPEEVLFMLKCTHCQKNSNYWEDSTVWIPHETLCPKCQAVMNKKDTNKGKVLTTTYTCPSCGHSYKDKLDFTIKKEKADPDFEEDRKLFCLTDEKILNELREAKSRYEQMASLGKEFKEKEDNKHIYDAMKELKKPKIAELTPLLAPALEKAGYTEFSMDRPEMGRDVYVGFSCLDSKSGREDYDSRKTLRKLVDKALVDTNWRLMSDGISYRLGYLNGRLRAYEQEEDIKKLVIQTRKLKPKQVRSAPTDKLNETSLDDGKGGRIQF
jgi:predicted RNA-binding Zn-ribbon protein involved in translation (DUF1610 family)